MNLTQQYTGGCRYLYLYPAGRHMLLVAVPCLVADLPDTEIALLDTGAEWCVLPPAVAQSLGALEPGDAPLLRLSTRLGTVTGHLERIPVRFPAEVGASLTVDATWFISPDWPGPLVVGWKGCLERLRFALDPGEETFYFGKI